MSFLLSVRGQRSRIPARRAADETFEGCAEGALRPIPDLDGDSPDWVDGVEDALFGQRHSPLHEIAQWCDPNQLFEFDREAGSRHTGVLRQGV